MGMSLSQAAERANKSKSVLSRAIGKGKLSAVRKEDGSYEIDPAELDRWTKNVATERRKQPMKGTEDNPEFIIENRVLQAKLEGIVEERNFWKQQVDELKNERDDWKKQAQTLLLTAAKDEAHKRSGGFWQWLVGRKTA